MPEIGSSGLMSGDGKRGVGHRPQATAPILDSTVSEIDARQESGSIDLVGPLPRFPFERVASQKFDAELITINTHQLTTPIRETG